MGPLPGESRTFNGFLVGALLGVFAVPGLLNHYGFSSPYEALAAGPGSGPALDPWSVLVFLCASHAAAFGAGFLAARTSGVRERLVASAAVWVGSALLAYASVPGSLSVFLVLASTGSWAAFALLGGSVARRSRLRREGRNTPG